MSEHNQISFSQLIDLLLARLYDVDQKQGPGKYYFLNALAEGFKEKVPFQLIFDAAKVMEARGLIRAIYMQGAVQATLTGEGRLFVEEEQGTGAIREYRKDPSHFVIVTGNGNQVNVGSPQATQTMTIE